MHVSLSAHCGGTIVSWYSVIKSPDFPNNYGSSIECEWYLKMAIGYHISLSIREFETPAASNCSLTDYLEIREKNAQGKVLQWSVHLSQGRLTHGRNHSYPGNVKNLKHRQSIFLNTWGGAVSVTAMRFNDGDTDALASNFKQNVYLFL